MGRGRDGQRDEMEGRMARGRDGKGEVDQPSSSGRKSYDEESTDRQGQYTIAVVR